MSALGVVTVLGVHPYPLKAQARQQLLRGRSHSRTPRTESRLQHHSKTTNLTSPGSRKQEEAAGRRRKEEEAGGKRRKQEEAGAMAMALQSPLHLDSLSNGFLGMGLSSPRPSPASQVAPKLGTNIRMAIKRWERKEVKENSLPVVQKLHVKIGDTVKVIAGHDKGKISTITQLYTHNSKILLKDVNLKTKHVKGKAEGEIGQIVQVEAPIHSSNVMHYSKTAKVASRVGHKTLEDGSRVRFLLKTGEVIDSAEEWKKIHKKKEEKKE